MIAEPPRRKILYLTNRVPYPPDKGDRIRTFHQIDRLSLRHDVYCATFTESSADLARAERLRRWCRDVMTTPFSKGPALARAAATWLAGGTLSHGAYHHRGFADRLDAWRQRQTFDAVVCFSSIMAPYARQIPARRKILDLCDVDSAKWSDYAAQARFPMARIYQSEAVRLAAFETAASLTFDETIVITPRERRILDPDGANPRIHVISNGVRRVSHIVNPAVAGPVVGFLGTMNYRPNVDAACWFADRVWPTIRHTLPNAQFLIMGRAPTRAVRRLAAREGIVVSGAVADMQSWIDRCRIIVAPLRIARGLPNKILEAMAAGRPVVATTAAASCLEAEPGRHLLVADEADEFARCAVQLLIDNAACHEIGREALAWVRTHHNWQVVLNQFERLILGDDPAPVPPAQTRGDRALRMMVGSPVRNPGADRPSRSSQY